MAKRMAEEIAAAEKRASEQIEAAGVKAGEIIAEAKRKANETEATTLDQAQARSAQIIDDALHEAEAEKTAAGVKAKETAAALTAQYEQNKTAAIQKAEEILLS